MNITEIAVTDRVLISRRPWEKEMAIINGFTPDGRILVKDTSGHVLPVTPEQILKKF